MSSVPERTPEQTAALSAVWTLLEADEADWRIRWAQWPQNDAPASVAAEQRINARAADGGAMDRALAGVHAAFGGRMPAAVDDEIAAEIERRAFALPGGRIIQEAMYGTGRLADASRGLLRALEPNATARPTKQRPPAVQRD